MGKIISEDATNIFFPQTCDVLADDVDRIIVKIHDVTLRSIQGTKYQTYKAFHFDSDKTELLTQRVE